MKKHFLLSGLLLFIASWNLHTFAAKKFIILASYEPNKKFWSLLDIASKTDAKDIGIQTESEDLDPIIREKTVGKYNTAQLDIYKRYKATIDGTTLLIIPVKKWIPALEMYDASGNKRGYKWISASQLNNTFNNIPASFVKHIVDNWREIEKTLTQGPADIKAGGEPRAANIAAGAVPAGAVAANANAQAQQGPGAAAASAEAKILMQPAINYASEKPQPFLDFMKQNHPALFVEFLTSTPQAASEVLNDAAANGDLNLVTQLLRIRVIDVNYNIQKPSSPGIVYSVGLGEKAIAMDTLGTPLIRAIKRKHNQIVKLLLDHGANPNIETQSREIVKASLGHQYNINISRTALMDAITHDNLEGIKLILNAKSFDSKFNAEKALEVLKLLHDEKYKTEVRRLLAQKGIGAVAPAGGLVIPEE